MSHTCGNIDGKNCEWFQTIGCPAEGISLKEGRGSEVDHRCNACAPMLALVEARAAIKRMNPRIAELVLECANREIEADRLKSDLLAAQSEAGAMNRKRFLILLSIQLATIVALIVNLVAQYRLYQYSRALLYGVFP